jgi:hypothetical protein
MAKAQSTSGDCSPIILDSRTVKIVCEKSVGNQIVLDREDGAAATVSRYMTYQAESHGPYRIGSEFRVVNADRSDAFLHLREMNGRYLGGRPITNIYFQPVFNKTWDGFLTSETVCGEVSAWYNVTGTGIQVIELMVPDLEPCDGRDIVIEFVEALGSARYVLGDNNYRMILLDQEGRPNMFFVMQPG